MKLEDDRKCWRLVNGVLFEKTKKEVIPEMRTMISNLANVTKQLSDAVLELVSREVNSHVSRNISGKNEGEKLQTLNKAACQHHYGQHKGEQLARVGP